MNERERELTQLFRKLGARNPEVWARSQVREGIPQLSRFLFLRQAWRLVLTEDDRTWISEGLKYTKGPGGEIGPALNRLIAVGADEKDISTVVRVMQWRLLFGLCLLLNDPGGDIEDEVKHIEWRLFQVDDNDQPIDIIGGLHESVLETDPSGREMRPKDEQL